MNLIVFGIGILLCLVVGILLSYFTELNWLPAALLVFATLHLHAALLEFGDARANRNETPDHEQPQALASRSNVLWFWLRTLLVTLIIAGLGAYLQVYMP